MSKQPIDSSSMAEGGGDANGNGRVALSSFVPQEKEEGAGSAGKGTCSMPALSPPPGAPKGAVAVKSGLFPSLPKEEIRDLQVMFEAFDKNQDGRLSSDELYGWMRRLGLRLSRESLLRIIDSPDGSVNFAQFLSLNQSLQEEKEEADNDDDGDDGEAEEERKSGAKDEEEEEGEAEGEEEENGNKKKKKSGAKKEKKSDMAQAFALFDKNGDGLISPNELGQTLNDLGLLERGKVYHWDSMVRRVDEDGDGRVNLSEFQTMMTRK